MDLSYFLYIVYFFTGLIAGVLAGLLGIGGGIVIVPVLFFLFGALGYADALVIKLAAATSLATIIGTGFSSTLSHCRLGSVQLGWLAWLAPSVVLGAVLGMVLVDVLAAPVLTFIFAIAELIVAARMLYQSNATPDANVEVVDTLQKCYWLIPAGLFIGTISSLAGIGGGVLTVPLLLFLSGQMRAAVGTSAAVGLCIAIPGVLSAVILGFDEPALPDNTLGYVVWPAALAVVAGSMLTAPLGARLAHQLPVNLLKQLFAVVLLVAGIRMLWAVWT